MGINSLMPDPFLMRRRLVTLNDLGEAPHLLALVYSSEKWEI